ncbi:MAG: hypothetical protein AB7Q17_13420 [Phycisphaerae bacterium]
MSAMRCGWLVGMVLWVSTVGVPAAGGDILDDIFSIATAARDRATEARNNAASARDRAIEARNNAAAARDTAIEMRDNMQAGLQALSAQVQDAIEEAVEDLQRDIQDEIAGRDAFIQSGAADPFRANLAALVQRTEALFNALSAASGMANLTIDFGRLESAILALPDRALYPLYRTLVVEMNLFAGGALLTRLDEAAAQLALLAQVMSEADMNNGSASSFLDGELARCEFVFDNYDDIRLASSALSALGGTLKLVGVILSAAGETQIHSTGGVWGWVGVSLKNNRTKKVGIALSGAADAIFAVTGYAGTKLRYCAGVAIQSEQRDREEQILANQREIVELLKVHARAQRQ